VQSQDRFKTILVIVTGLLGISWYLASRGKQQASDILFKISFFIGLVSIFIPIAAKGIEWFWFKLALGLGWINSRILLSVIYFVVLLPIAWLSRLFTKDPLMLRRDNSTSMFVTRNHQYTKKDLENIW
jgi:hypothetical protein